MKPRGARVPKARVDETAVLPPLDDDGEVVGDGDGGDLGLVDGEASLDDSVSEEFDTGIDLEADDGVGREGADEADDADVGDLAEDIDDTEDNWTGEDAPHAHDDRDDAIGDIAALADDDDDEGIDDLGSDVIDERAFRELNDEVDETTPEEAFADTLEPERTALPAFALPKPQAGVAARIATDGLVFAAAVHRGNVMLAGDGVFSLERAGLEARGSRARTAPRVGHREGEWIASIVSLDDDVLLAATMAGDVLRSDDGAATWLDVAALGGEDVGKSAVELIAEGGNSSRVWARAHGGGWFRSENAGRTWEGPVLPQPVRVAAAFERTDGIVVATSGWAPQLLRCVDGQRWESISATLPAAPSAIACSGDAWAIAFGRAPGLVTLDAGRTFHPWPVLAGATALAWCTADDGALHLVAAIHDEAGDHATIVRAGVDASGLPRNAQRIADIDGVFERTFDAPGEDGDERIEQLLRLDPKGTRFVFVPPRGVGLILAEY